MKQCPLCKVKFEDDAQFCPGCKAELEDYAEAEKKENEKVPKSFWWALIAVFAFIGGMYIIYTLLYGSVYS